MSQETLQSLTSSETENKIKDSTRDIIKESQEILAKLKEKFWEQSPEYQKVKKEYDDVQKSILESLKNDRKITQEELNFIELEFTNLLKMKVWDSAVASVLNQTWKLARWVWADSSKVDFLWDSVKVTNQYQEDLIKKVLWADYEKWFNDKYLKWYNKNVWNFLVKIEDFEKDLKDDKVSIRDINSRTLGNYFLHLKSKWQLTWENVIDIFWANKLYWLREVWEEKDPDAPKMRVTKQIMQDNWLWDVIKIIELFSSPDNFLNWVQNLWKNQEQAKIAFKLFEKNTNSIKDEFKRSLKEKFLKSNPGKEADAEKIINEMMEELEKHKDLKSLPEIFRIFDTYNEKYKLKLSISQEAKKLIALREQENRTQMIRLEQEMQKAKDSKDSQKQQKIKKEQDKLILDQKQIQAMSWVMQKTSDSEIKKIVSWEVSYEDYLDKLMKNDESFKEIIEDLQKQEKTFYEKYPEEKNIKTPEEITVLQQEQVENSSNTFSYSDWTTFTYEQVSSWIYIVNNLTINSDEFDTIKRNKDALKNMENFKQTLEDLNLWWLWKYREPIFKAISNKYTVEFNAKDDYLNSNELKIFLNAILKSIWYKWENITNLQDIKTQINVFNKVWVLSWMKDVNIYWNSLIEKSFIELYDKDRTWILDQNILEKNLWNLFWKTM